MNKNSAKDYLPLVQALADGEILQFNLKGGERDGKWEDIVELNAFNKNPEFYRVKPKPIERWTVLWKSGMLHDIIYNSEGEVIARYSGDLSWGKAIKLVQADD